MFEHCKENLNPKPFFNLKTELPVDSSIKSIE